MMLAAHHGLILPKRYRTTPGCLDATRRPDDDPEMSRNIRKYDLPEIPSDFLHESDIYRIVSEQNLQPDQAYHMLH